MSEFRGQNIIVENRSGGRTIGSGIVANATAYGYTRFLKALPLPSHRWAIAACRLTKEQRALPNTLPFTVAWDETFDVGLETGTSVDDRDYTSPNPFTGRIVRLTIDLGDSTITPASLQALQDEMARRQIRRN